MSDDFDMDEFEMADSLPASTAGKKAPKKGGGKGWGFDPASMMQDLLAESQHEARNAERVQEVINTGGAVSLMQQADSIAKATEDFDAETAKAKTAETEAQGELDQEAIMNDTSISVAGAIHVLKPPQRAAPVDLPFDADCPRPDLQVLFDALKRAAGDPTDLEDLLRGALVPWVRQKLEGNAPVEVCRWLLVVVAKHDRPAVVLAAEEALLELLAEGNRSWKLKFGDMVEIWRACGAIWLAKQDGDSESVGDDDNDDDADGGVHLRRNLRPALNVVEACLRKGASGMNNAELRDLLLDLAAASLDVGVTEVYHTMKAVVDAIATGYYEDDAGFSSLVNGLCDPSARGLEGRMRNLSFVLLARNIPYTRRGMCGVGGGRCSSLRHEVCHKILQERFLSNTTYSQEEVGEGFDRAIKALEVLLHNEDNLWGDESEEGYERQYVIVSLANDMAAGALAVSRDGKPDAEQSKRILGVVFKINEGLKSVMQSCVQMSKTVLDMMKSKYTPYLAASSGRQSILSFGRTPQDDDGENDDDEDEHDHDDSNDYDDNEIDQENNDGDDDSPSGESTGQAASQ